MALKPQDILVILKLSLLESFQGYADLAKSLGMSASETHASVKRLEESRLVESGSLHVRFEALRQFLIHGVPYSFPAQTREITRGIPTAWAHPILKSKLAASDQLLPVWPDPQGKFQGVAIKPLYKSVPMAALLDANLHELLALVDALRTGRARERNLAAEALTSHLKMHVSA